jgi:hypothetical protein
MLRHFVSNVVNERMPIKTKRQVFLVSFAALLRGATTFDKEIFKKLNRVLALSESGETALAVPAILSKVIWNGKTSYEVCQEDVMEGTFSAARISSVVANILNSMPKCLLYGTTEDIEKDIGVILKGRIELLGA